MRFSDRMRSTRWPIPTSRRSSSPATRRRPSRCRTCARRYDLPILGVIRPGAAAAALATRSRRVGVIATPATVRSHAYFDAIKDENPAVEVYEHATPRSRAAGRGGHPERCRSPRRRSEAGAGAAPRRARRRRRVHLPAAGVGADRHAAPRLHALPAAAAPAPGGGRRPGGDRRLGDRHRVGAGRAAVRERPRGAGDHARDGGRRRPQRARPAVGVVRGRRARPAHHRGRRAFRSIASRMFGESFPDVEAVELAVAR